MYAVSAGFKTAVKQPSRVVSAKVVIGSNTYLTDNIISLSYEDTSNPDTKFELGAAASAMVKLSLLNVTDAFESAMYMPYLGVEVSGSIEWVPLGRFYADEVKRKKNVVDITLFDGMIKLEKGYFSSLSYPATITNVVNEIMTKTGFSFSGTLPAYTIPEPKGYTYREVIRYIAQLAGGFAKFDRSGNLTIKSYSATATDSIGVDNYIDYQKTREAAFRVDKFTVQVDSSTQLTEGTLAAGGAEVVFENPWMTNTILTNIYNSLNGFTYYPTVCKLQGNPSYECGDKITLTTVDSLTITIPVMKHTLTYSGGIISDIESVGESDNSNSFSGSGSVGKQVERIIVQQAVINQALINKAEITDLQATNGRIDNLVVTTAMIQNLAVSSAKIADAAITNAKIQDLAVTTAKIQDAQITTAKIKLGAITTALIDTGAIGEAQIADASITDAKIVTLTANKLTAGTIDASQINVTNLVADNIVVGTITIASANKIENSDFQSGDWSQFSSHAAEWTVDTTKKFNGSNTAKVVVTGQSTNVSKSLYTNWVAVGEGEDWVASIYTYADDISTINTTARLMIEWYDAAKTTRISAPTQNVIPSQNGVWERNILKSTCPAGAVWARIRCYPSQNGTFWATRIMLTKGKLAIEWQPSTNDLLIAKGITNLHIGDSAVDNRVVAYESLNADRLVANSITARYIASKTITANEIAANTITAASGIIADAAITTAMIGDAQITNAKIVNLDGSKITANSIGSEKILVGDYTNLATADEMFAETMTTSYAGGESIISGGYIAKKAIANSNLMLCNHSINPLKTNDEIAFEFDGYLATASTVNVGVWCYDANKTFLGSNTSSAISLTTTSAGYKGSFKLTNANFSTAAYYLIGISGVANKDVKIKNFRAWRKLKGELIVDGSILASHISSLNGLNVGSGNFVIDANGNVSLKGAITSGSTISLSGTNGTIYIGGDLVESRKAAGTTQYDRAVMTSGKMEVARKNNSDDSIAWRISNLGDVLMFEGDGTGALVNFASVRKLSSGDLTLDSTKNGIVRIRKDTNGDTNGVTIQDMGNGVLQVNNTLAVPSGINNITDWTTFYASMLLGWTTYTTNPYYYPSYKKDANKMVQLRGALKGGTNGTIYTLPSTYRPANWVGFPITCGAGLNVVGYCLINPSGQIGVYVPSGANTWVTLDGIEFQADGS